MFKFNPFTKSFDEVRDADYYDDRYVRKVTFDAQTLLIAVTDNTPQALSVGEQRVVGRTTGGDISALTGAQLWTILNAQAGANVSMNSKKFTSVADPTDNQDADTKAARDTALAVHAAIAAAHHARYTDAEVDAIVAVHAALASAHHAKYLDSEAVAAMGAKANDNPLNHDKYTDAEVSALIAIHAALADPHTGYVKESEFTAENDVLVGTAAGTLAKKTPAELLAILSAEDDANYHHIKLPYGIPKEGGSNPVVDDPGNLELWNGQYIQSPCLFLDPTTGKIMMSVCALGTTAGTKQAIGFYEATSFPNTWAEIAGNPKISKGGVGADDEYGCLLATAFYDPLDTDSDKRFKVFYTGYDSSYNTTPLWATAPSITGSWTKQGAITGLTNYKWGANFFRTGTVNFFAFADTAGDLKIAYANNYLTFDTFTTKATILQVGAGGAWDDDAVNYFSLFYSNGVWYMPYSGRAGAADPWQIGLATCTDPDWGTAFTKLLGGAGNPILTESGSDWREIQVLFPSLYKYDSEVYLFCHAREDRAGTNYDTIGWFKWHKADF